MTGMPLQGEPLMIPDRPFGRIVRSVLGYAVLTALMFLTQVMLVFMPAAVFHCGVRNGRRAAWIAAFAGFALALLAAVTSATSAAEARMAVAYLAAECLALAVPALLVLPLIARRAPFGSVLMSSVLAATPGLALAEIGSRTFLGFSLYADQLRQYQEWANGVIAMFQHNGAPSDMLGAVQHSLDLAKLCVPSGGLTSVIVFFVLSILMFGRLRAWREFVNTRQASNAPDVYAFRNLSLPDWLLFAFVLGGAAPLLSGLLQKVAGNLLAVVILLYFLQGLAVFRALLAAVGIGTFGLVFALATVVFLTFTGGIAPILLTIAGLFDSFFDFRKFRRKDDSHEGHTD